MGSLREIARYCRSHNRLWLLPIYVFLASRGLLVQQPDEDTLLPTLYAQF